MDVRNAFDLGPRVRLVFPEDEGRARQEMMAECDINNIMAKYQKSGAVDHFARHSASYGFATSEDFHSATNLVIKASGMFTDLPSKVRERFDHDPGAFLAFVQDEANLSEMADLGLMREGFEPPVPEPDVPVLPVVAEPPAGDPPIA